jgi:hypothetical protein
MNPSVELHIEELVLHGFPPGDRHRIAQAVQQELTRLFTEQGVPASFTLGGNSDRLEGGTFNMAPNARAQVIGNDIAQSVYTGLTK